jgi:hypothetical protein
MDGVNAGFRGRLADGPGEHRGDGLKLTAKTLYLARLDQAGTGEWELRLFLLQLALEDLARARDGVSLVVEEALDPQRHFDVAAAVEALAGAALVGLQLGELALPEAQNISRDFTEACNLSDAEVKLVGDFGRPGGVGISAHWFVLSHSPERTLTQKKLRPKILPVAHVEGNFYDLEETVLAGVEV